MLPLDGFHVEVDSTGFGIATDGGIAGVGERAGLTVTEASNIVLVAAEILLFGCPISRIRISDRHWHEKGDCTSA